MHDLTGQSIGKYHLVQQLGEGGMAVVYKAFDTQLERDVAIKLIRMDQFGSAMLENIRKRFDREAKTLAKLTHPNIVGIHDYGEYEGIPYLVMEYLPGGTLKQKMGKPIPYAEAVRLLLPIANALTFAHKKDIIHRDVKPVNILMTGSDEPMLTDFGIAKILDLDGGNTLTGTGVGIGTPEYMAPEQGAGKDVDGRADIYSLGIVLYELVTGRTPFIADTPLAVIVKQMTDSLPRPKELVPDLPDEMEKVLFKALAKQPEDRYQSMTEFAAALSGIANLNVHFQSSSLDGTVVQIVKKDHTAEGEMHSFSTEYGVKVDVGNPIEEPVQAQKAEKSSAKREKKGIGEEEPVRPKKNNKALTFLKVIVRVLIVIGIALLILWKTGNLERPITFVQTQMPVLFHQAPSAIKTPPTYKTPTNMPFRPTPTDSFGIGSSLVSESDGMVMMYVPTGEFTMGSTESRDTQPIHTVHLDAYWIDQTEVTNAMYKKCVDSGACTAPHKNSSFTRISYYNTNQYADFPVIYVDWTQAKTYCEWAGRELPTEAQWEKAARGTNGQTYPWGETVSTCNLVNFYGCKGDTTKVGSYEAGKSPYGVYDMAGNVYELPLDWFSTYSSKTVSNPLGPVSGSARIFRGGSWRDDASYMYTTFRQAIDPSINFDDIGFRCTLHASLTP